MTDTTSTGTQLTTAQLRVQIELWLQLAKEEGVTLPNKKTIPNKFFHVVLGIGESTFKTMVSGKSSIRAVPKYTTKHISVLNKLSKKAFLDELRSAIPEYLELQKKTKPLTKNN